MKKKSFWAMLSSICCILFAACFVFIGCGPTKEDTPPTPPAGEEEPIVPGGGSEGSEEWQALSRVEAEEFIAGKTHTTEGWGGLYFQLDTESSGNILLYYDYVDGENGDSYMFLYNTVGVPYTWAVDIKEYATNGWTYCYHEDHNEEYTLYTRKMNDYAAKFDLFGEWSSEHYDFSANNQEEARYFFAIRSAALDIPLLFDTDEMAAEEGMAVEWNSFGTLQKEGKTYLKVVYTLSVIEAGVEVGQIETLIEYDSNGKFVGTTSIKTDLRTEEVSTSRFYNYEETISVPEWFDATDDFELVEKYEIEEPGE